MKKSDRISEEHDAKGTDPFDDPAFLAALEEEDDFPIEGSQWNPDWVNEILNEYHRNTITMQELRARLRAKQVSDDGISAILGHIDQEKSRN